MKRFTIILIAMLAIVAAQAQTKRGQNPVKFVYDVDFQYFFSNNEYDHGGELYDSSQTFNSARLTPMVGVRVDQNRKTRHYLWLGIDIMKNMGEYPTNESEKDLENTDLFHEIVFWYSFERKFRFGNLSGYFGIFPKKYAVYGSRSPLFKDEFPLSEAELVPTYFTSKIDAFYDNNMEGFLMSLDTKNGYYEAGLDWTGKYGKDRRESFRVFTYGSQGIGRSGVRLGWAQTYFHYANSYEVKGVVDNHIISPFAGYYRKIDDWKLGFRLGYALGINRDREKDTGFQISNGGLFTANVNWKGFGILNDAYYGQSLMPYYDQVDAGGYLYADNVYKGSPFYKINEASGKWSHSGFYDRAEGYWQRTFGNFVAVRVGMVFHFSEEGYQGWQEQLSLIFDLNRAISRYQKPNAERRYYEYQFSL
jgi:hypothetical protein